MEYKHIISTKEEVDSLPDTGCYYRPYQYLSRNLFTKEILLDIFCSEKLVYTYEDDWYNDLTLEMITNLQPHINKDEFSILWHDLDEILVVEQFCKYILNYPNYIVAYNYNNISDYIKSHDIRIFIDNMLCILKNNNYIQKYNLYNIIQEIETINKNDMLNDINTISDLKIVTARLLSTIPEKYSNILPL